MTDPENFKRALRVRRELAHDEGNRSYVSYSDSLLSFLAPIPAHLAIFLVLIATEKATYEFFYAPQLGKTLAHRVSPNEALPN